MTYRPEPDYSEEAMNLAALRARTVALDTLSAAVKSGAMPDQQLAFALASLWLGEFTALLAALKDPNVDLRSAAHELLDLWIDQNTEALNETARTTRK